MCKSVQAAEANGQSSGSQRARNTSPRSGRTEPLPTPTPSHFPDSPGRNSHRGASGWPGRKRSRRLCVCLPVIVGQRRGQLRCGAGVCRDPQSGGAAAPGASPPRRNSRYAYPGSEGPGSKPCMSVRASPSRKNSTETSASRLVSLRNALTTRPVACSTMLLNSSATPAGSGGGSAGSSRSRHARRVSARPP